MRSRLNVAAAVPRRGVKSSFMDVDRVWPLNDRCRPTASDVGPISQLWQVLMVAGGVACGLLLLLPVMAAWASPVTVDWRSVRPPTTGRQVRPLASDYGRNPTAGNDSGPSTRRRHTQTLQMTMERPVRCAEADDWNDRSLTHSINPCCEWQP